MYNEQRQVGTAEELRVAVADPKVARIEVAA
jgi:hypothetical protein